MKQLFFISVFLLAIVNSSVHAEIIRHYSIQPGQDCNSTSSLAVVAAKQLPYLLGHQLSQLSFYRFSSSDKESLYPVLFQIDQKDAQGRYVIDIDAQPQVLGVNDEVVFRIADTGERLDRLSSIAAQQPLIEIEINNEVPGQPSRWLYIDINPVTDNAAIHAVFSNQLVFQYNDELDHVTSSDFRIGFSAETPFLIDSFQWYSETSGWSNDISDMMKIRHQGKFLGFNFNRDQNDYQSRLLAVKKGALRIIRRTENRIKVLWKLKTPALYIDYIMMPDGFVMDTMVDIPFKVSLFFSDLETITTMDWSPEVELMQMMIHDDNFRLNLLVNGHQDIREHLFNEIEDTQFSVSTDKGQFNVRLDIPDNFPIKSQLYLNDNANEMDPPEHYPGQYGNVGFRTTGWEYIDSQLHHLKFTVCLQPKP